MLREKKIIRNKVLQTVIHSHFRSQNSGHEKNSSLLRTDDSLWVEDLENVEDDSIQ